MTIFPAIRYSTDAGGERRRNNVTGLPKAGAKVFLDGVDTVTTGLQTAVSGKTTARSFLIADDTTQLIYALPKVDDTPGVNIQKHRFPEAMIEFCIAIQGMLPPFGTGGTTGSTLTQVWSRYGLGADEYEGGFRVGTEEVNA